MLKDGEYKMNNKGKNNPFYGKHHTEKTKKVIGIKSRQRWNNKKYREKLRKRFGWKKHRDINGYILIKDYKHPNRNSHNDVLEHIKIMSDILKRPINKEEIVHHINFVRDDNRKFNLWLYPNRKSHIKCTRSIFKLVKELLNNKIIIFKKGEYILGGIK